MTFLLGCNGNRRTLDTFLKVFRSEAVGKTARRTNLARTAVSRRLKGLEQEPGATLFVTEGRGIRPTALTVQLVPRVEAAFQAMEDVTADARGGRDGPRILRGAATAQTIASLIVPAFLLLAETGITLDLIEAGGADISARVLHNSCECGITAHPAFETGLHSRPVETLSVGALAADIEALPGQADTAEVSRLFDRKLLVFGGTLSIPKGSGSGFSDEQSDTADRVCGPVVSCDPGIGSGKGRCRGSALQHRLPASRV